MPRIRLTLEYDGTDFVGWQRQLNGRSVQTVVEAALAELLGVWVTTTAAGRTDSGVHALGQVVAFDAPAAARSRPTSAGSPGCSPGRVGGGCRRGAGGLRSATLGDWQTLPLLLDPPPEPLATPPPDPLGAVRGARRRSDARGSPALVGTHDFSSFRAADCEAPHARRTLRLLQLTEGEETLHLELEGTAFLKHMVRNIVGSLVEVGRGKHSPSWIGEVLAARDRTLAGPTAPSHGLTLVEVTYGDGPRPMPAA
jgi:tRNA pseudouridine38-40 synthase